jgi:transposase
MGHFWLSEAQFAKIAPHFPTDTQGKERVDDRRVISGIVHVLKSGGRWADAPREVYGPKKTLYNRFVRWAGLGRACGPVCSKRWREQGDRPRRY